MNSGNGCGHTADEHAAIIRNKVGDLLTPADRVRIMTTAEAVAEARLELEEL